MKCLPSPFFPSRLLKNGFNSLRLTLVSLELGEKFRNEASSHAGCLSEMHLISIF
jgi:hypothetical protein